MGYEKQAWKAEALNKIVQKPKRKMAGAQASAAMRLMPWGVQLSKSKRKPWICDKWPQSIFSEAPNERLIRCASRCKPPALLRALTASEYCQFLLWPHFTFFWTGEFFMWRSWYLNCLQQLFLICASSPWIQKK